MSIGNIVRRAASAFGKTKTRGTPTSGTPTTGPKGPTGARKTGGSPEAKLAKSAAKVAKKKL